MKIVTLSTYDILGGAARSAWRLHAGLRPLGVDSTMLVRQKASNDPTVSVIPMPSPTGAGQWQRWENLANRLINQNRTDRSGILFTLPVPGYDLASHAAVQSADVIHLHWVYSLLSPGGIQRLLELGKPVVWTLHDQRAFTGGCHFSFGCTRYEEGCGMCPELRDNNADLSRWLLADARRALDPSRIVVVTPSRWLAECARRSGFFRGSRIEVIPYGLETDVFRPLHRKAAREALGLPQDCFVLLFGADNATEKRKGFFVLAEALGRCRADFAFARALGEGRIKLLSFGKGSENATVSGLPVHSLGYLEDDQKLAQIFAASDLLLCPTLDDNLPNVIMEARACGTPVLACRVGGVPELVMPGETGELFEPGDAAGFTQSLLVLWREPDRIRALRERSLELAGVGFELETQARRYVDLYKDLLATPPEPRVKPPKVVDPLPLLPATWPESYFVWGPGASAAQYAPNAGLQADLYYLPEQGNGWRPTYSGPSPFLSQQHGRIWSTANGWEGWPDENECRKLYELGFHSGWVIFEFGSGGCRSALVALEGALAGGKSQTQYFAAVKDPVELSRRAGAVEMAGRAAHCLFFRGGALDLLRELPIVPSLVIINGPETEGGSGCHLQVLRWVLAHGSMVLCRGYPDDERVRQAVDRALRTAQFEFMGLFSSSVLLRATGACRGAVTGLPHQTFVAMREALAERYREKPARNGCIDISDLTRPVRDKLAPAVRVPNSPAPWPYAAPSMRPLPATLPGGHPWPRITVVTPSFNQGCYLEETILSVLNQNYPNLEYIVMDGGSTDESGSILKRYGDRLAFWASEKDRGQCHAINKGFARATGEILTWLNSDDMLAPGALAAVALAQHISGADMVSGICQLFRQGKLVNQHLTSCEDGPLPLDRLLDQENCWEQGHFFYQPEVFFTRDIWQRAGGKLDESLYFSLDYELWLRFAKAGAKLKVVGVPLALYRIHEAQKTFYAEKFLPELRKVREDFLGNKTGAKSAPANVIRKDRLRIALVNDMGFRFGAGIAHQRLGRALAAAGHDLVVLGAAGEQITDPAEAQQTGAALLKRIEEEKPDMVLLGNVHASQFDGGLLDKIAREWPTVFVAHDTWIFTGRCAYTGDCQRFLTGCDEACPTPNEYPQLASAEIFSAWSSKRQLLEQASALVVATNSQWLTEKGTRVLEAMRVAGRTFQAGLRTIRYGLPLDIFQPRDPDLCREMLGLPRDKFLLFFCCTHVEDTRKGISHLIEALLRLRLPDLVPVCLGAGANHLRTQLPDLVSIDYALEPQQQAMLYSAADLFVGPSLEEAFGQVFIEAAACGTPAIAYAVDGVPEAVADGLSGMLVSSPHPGELALAIEALYHNPQLRRNLGAWGALWAKLQFSFEASYHSLFGALRDALDRRGVHLSGNLCFPPQPAPLPNPVYLRAPPIEPTPFQRQMEVYFQQELDFEREKPWPWILNPRAWLARINRDLLRRAGKGKTRAAK